MSNMDAPFFSVIIPTFNSGRTLSIVLESILHQDFSNFEVLIIDGASKDDTLHIAKEFNDSRIKVVSEPDSGIYDAMNNGIGLAKGDWIYFLGSDDELTDNEVLQRVANELSGNQCELLYGNVKMYGEASWAESGTIYDGSFTIEKLFTKNICHQAVFYKRELFQRLGVFNIEYKVCADWDFNHRCFANASTRYFDLVIANFSAGGQSTNVTSDKFTDEDFVINLGKYYKVGYGNRIFRNCSPVFFNLAVRRLKSRQMASSLYFLLFSILHGNHKMGLIKNYMASFLSSKSTSLS